MGTNNQNVAVNVIDNSALSPKRAGTKFIVQAVTEFGIPNRPYEVNSEQEYLRILGKPLDRTGVELIRGLQAGASFIVFPIGHFTDPTDETTIVGTLASGTITNTETVPFAIPFKGKTVGSAYNDVVISFALPRSNSTTTLDMFVSHRGNTQTKRDVPINITADIVSEINNEFDLINIDATAAGHSIVVGTCTLANGAKDISLIDDDDIIAGIDNFGDVLTEVFRIMNITKQNSTVDGAYIQYADNTNMSCHIFAPLNLSKSALITYRNAYDSNKARLVAGGLKVKHPYNSKLTLEILGAGDLAAAITEKDAIGVHFATASDKYGIFGNGVIDVVTNFKGVDYEDLNNIHGINLITNTSGTIKYNGNNTMLKDRTKSLSTENISDLLIVMERWAFKLGLKYKFEQNTQTSIWQPMYKEARLYFESLVANQAIYGGEGTAAGNWQWIGDQDAQTLADLAFNTPQEIASRQYKVQARFTPISAMEYMTINLVVLSGN